MANYYFDANALIKYSTLQEYKANLGQIEMGVNEIRQIALQENTNIYYSSLTLLECWRVIFLYYRKNIFGKNKNKAFKIVIEKFMVDLQQPVFSKLNVDMSESVISQAHKFIERYGTINNVGSIDMLHIALVKASLIESLIMVSSDRVVKNICNTENIKTFDPEDFSVS